MKKTMISFLIAIGTVVVVVVARAARVEMAWHFPLTQSHQGIPFGNAVNGYLVWGEGRTLKVTIGRDDVWESKTTNKKKEIWQNNCRLNKTVQ